MYDASLEKLKLFYYKTLLTVGLNADKTELQVDFIDGSQFILGVEGDCCSKSWIEHLTIGPEPLAGAKYSGYHEYLVSTQNVPYNLRQIYEAVICTDRGAIRMEFRNDSNGYYGGNVYLISAKIN